MAEKEKKNYFKIVKLLAAISVVIVSIGVGYFYQMSSSLQDDFALLQKALETLDALSDLTPQGHTLKYWSVCINKWNKNGNLRTMDRVFEKLGYTAVNASETFDFDILWSFEYPHKHLPEFIPLHIFPLKPHQRVNHIPGIFFITNKRALGIFTSSKYLLPTFVFPEELKEFNQYTAKHDNETLYVEKNSHNRGVRVVTIDEFDVTNDKKVYQLFMDKPFLIDGHLLDFGVYVLITSVNPLRIYRYDHEVFIRFCPKEYHPFDIKERERYVVDENYTIVYDMPSFKSLFDDYAYSTKSIFERIIEQKGFDVRNFWSRIDDAISDIIQKNEKFFIGKIKEEGFEASHHFFELVRFDFILDQELHPYVMEVSMSPTLTPSDDRFVKNQLIYEQLVYNSVVLIGGENYDTLMTRVSKDTISVYPQNLATNFKNCVKHKCIENCNDPVCAICMPCVTPEVYLQMSEAHREHSRRGNFKRIFPSAKHYNNAELYETLSENNRIMMKWFEAKCESDESWC